MRLIDFQSLDGNTSPAFANDLTALKRCRQENIHMLEFIGFSPQQADDIECLAPLWRKLPCWLYYYKAANQVLAENLANPMLGMPRVSTGIRRCRGLYSCQGCEGIF